MNDLVSTEWLASHLGSSDLAILDASWHLPAAKRDARAEFIEARIPGARVFDIDAISDTASPLPHMLPSPETFASRMGAMGIGDATRVIAYDSAGLFSARVRNFNSGWLRHPRSRRRKFSGPSPCRKATATRSGVAA